MRSAPMLLLGLSLACSASSSGGDSGGPVDPPVDTGPSSTRQTARALGYQGAPNGFYEYLPPGYPDGHDRPLLVFWHGVGENGNGTTELSRVLANGPPKLIARDAWPATRPFIVLSPQHAGGGCPSAAEIDAFLAWALGHHDVDARRVFLTGLSCGAIGSWSYLGAHRGALVAAALVIAGDPGDPAQSWSVWGKNGCALGEVAIWSVHGTDDRTVEIANDRATMQDLLACPPARGAVWTEVAGAGHDTWTATYDGSRGDVYAWLLAHAKP
jgi:predicted peptidase